MKALVWIGILVGAWYVWQGYQQSSRTGIPAYNEIRMDLKSGSRTVQLVSYVQRDSSESCEEIRVWWVESLLHCVADRNCRVTRNQCVDDIPAQYHNMFNQKKASTTYFRAENAVLARQGITLFWGLTDEEAVQVCSMIVQSIKPMADKNPDVRYRCI